GSAEASRTGEQKELGRRMIELFRLYRADEAELVRDALQVRHQIRDLEARLARAVEGETLILRRAEELRLLADERELLADEDLVRAERARAALQFGLRVEEVEVTRGADEVDVDDALGPWREMRARARAVFAKHRRERGSGEPAGGALKKLASRL